MRRLFAELDAWGRFPVASGELSIAVLDEAGIAALHAGFLDDPSVTDVITFPGDTAMGTAGEICVCADVARSYAKEHGTGLAEELALYLVHGYLHLSGLGDKTPAGRRRMRSAERLAMTRLLSAGLIPAVVRR